MLCADAVCRCCASGFWERDRFIDEVLTGTGIKTNAYNAVVLYEPAAARPDERPECLQMGFGSVGFFLSACQLLGEVPGPLPTVEGTGLPRPAEWPMSLPLEVLGLARMPVGPDGDEIDWAAGIRQHWVFGEAGAIAALNRFLSEGVYHFEKPDDRFRADKQYTAAISPYVRFGELSSRSIYHQANRPCILLRSSPLLTLPLQRSQAIWAWVFLGADPDPFSFHFF